jgi:hypothetical protein
MSNLTPAFDAELSKPSPIVFGAVSIQLPQAQVNLLDGAGVLTFGGRTYRGMDATYGTLASIEEISEGTGDEAPALSITLLPSGDAAAADLAAATMQGSPVLIYIGAVEPAFGTVVPDPQLIFVGELDVPRLVSKENGRELEYEVVSVFERLFDVDEGARIAPGFHKNIWTGELLFDEITGITQDYFWGVEGKNITGAVTPVYAGADRFGPRGGLLS